MKKSSLKNYITLLEKREHERRVEERLEAGAAADARDYWMRERERRDEELLKAKNHIAELERRSK